MKSNALILIFATMAILCATSTTAQDPIHKQDFDIYSPRYTDRLCPPEYISTAEWIKGFMMVDHMIGRFRKIFGDAAPASIDEVEILTDEEDGVACAYFAQEYDRLINWKVRLVDGADAHYLHDLTFYKGGEFYFVAVGGGYLIEDEPKHEDGRRRAYRSGAGGISVYRKEDFEHIPWEMMWDELQAEEGTKATNDNGG